MASKKNTAPQAQKKQQKKKSFWANMAPKQQMCFTLALCAVALLASIGGAFLITGVSLGGGIGAGAQTSETSSASLVAESGYNKDQNTINTSQYGTTILAQTSDAGTDYVAETLFLGDSNTARMYRLFNVCTYDNAIGSVGMSAASLKDYACVQFSGYSGYKTMPEAVALMQPRRVIITFGTNDLNPNQSADTFIAKYQAGVQAVQQSYPSVDIIINSIPPIGRERSNTNLTQTQVDEYNKAIVQMCQDQGWKYLNSAEALKDSTTGFAKDGYVISTDGIHLTQTGMDALFQYVRTHSYITDDDRPTLTKVPKHTGDKDVTVVTTVAATAAPTKAPSYTYTTEVKAPTCTEQGYTIYHCNEDSSKDYTADYKDALGHDYQNGVCTRCGAKDPNYVAPTAAPTPTPAPTASPTPVATPTPTAASSAAPSSEPTGTA